ncbi:MAG TPA: hypothetical protein VFA21_14025 [Pyrinomonadaceae bacterium]|nr:hypothetical protein [Pyrinomonadaceae bacterium]
MSKDRRRRSLPFFVLGAAFFAIGMSGHRSLLFVGLTFWLIGLMMLRRARR